MRWRSNQIQDIVKQSVQRIEGVHFPHVFEKKIKERPARHIRRMFLEYIFKGIDRERCVLLIGRVGAPWPSAGRCWGKIV
jgi:hypothetical protein